ncbi:MAG: hypothetical protein P4L43_08910 [Syntrophobacteraceae bacterium]|nr:hypothetical protein [Syntrophobacteraceae bacterium]
MEEKLGKARYKAKLLVAAETGIGKDRLQKSCHRFIETGSAKTAYGGGLSHGEVGEYLG